MRMLLGLEFANPALLAGIGGALAPLLIHLLLRARPRKVVFPALIILRESLASGQRAKHVRDFWLLCARAGMIAVLAACLATPTCAPTAASPTGEGLAVVLIDDSWSMLYRNEDGGTPMDEALRRAASVISRASRAPARQVVLRWASRPDDPSQPTTASLALAELKQSASAARAPSAVPLGQAVKAITGLLARRPDAAREVVLLTDMAHSAWRDIEQGAWANIPGLSVRVEDCAAGPRTNLALTALEAPARRVPETAPLRLMARCEAQGLAAHVTLTVTGEREGPAAQVELPAGGAATVPITLGPADAGPWTAAATLTPADRIPFDARRFVAFETALRPLVWLVSSAPEAEDLGPRIVANLLAPAALEDREQIVSLQHVAHEVLGAPQGALRPAMIAVRAGDVVSTSEWQALREYFEQGGVVFAFASAEFGETAPSSPLLKLFTPAPVRVETSPAPYAAGWAPDTRFAARDWAVSLWTSFAARRRLVFSDLHDGVEVHARFSDQAPALLERSVGAGRVLLLATSPDPRWSTLGVQAAGLLSWLHGIIQDSMGPPLRVAEFTVGQSSRRAFGGLEGRSTIYVSRLDQPEEPEIAVRVEDGAPLVDWPAPTPGAFAISTAPGRPALAKYVVNWPAEESDLRPIQLEEAKSRLGVAELTVRQREPEVAAHSSWTPRLQPETLLGLALLALALVEVRLSRTLAK